MDYRRILEKFNEECIRCGACLGDCSHLSEMGLSPGEIADEILSGQTDVKIIKGIQRCSLCGLCSQSCPDDLNPSIMMKAARGLLVEEEKIQLDNYEVMQVDRDWNFFTIYRSTYDITYDDLCKDYYDTLFFPGCTLSSYAPDLVHEVHSWLSKQGMKVGVTDRCCGKPLSDIGVEERAIAMTRDLEAIMGNAGAKRLITACPNCYSMLEKHIENVELISVYDLMREAGINIAGNEKLTFHDSCPDRYTMKTANNLRTLLSGFDQAEMEHNKNETICCGSGGIVSMIDPELTTYRAGLRIAEFKKTNADKCVTGCMACSYRLARSAPDGGITHILEIIFGKSVDYEEIAFRVKAMWEGEWGEYNLHRLSQARIITGEAIK